MVQFGEVIMIVDSKSPGGRKPEKGVKKWIVLDADWMPHGCKGRSAAT